MDNSSAQEIRVRYRAVDSSNVADVLDELGLRDQALAPALVPFPAAAGKLAGWAAPIQGEMGQYPLGDRDPRKMEACARLEPGSVSVWAGAGEGVCFFGELIALGMKERGCTGAIVDGGVRDLAWLGQMEFPVYARYRSPAQSIGRWRVIDDQVPVDMPGATSASVSVSPGDFVLGDEDGVIVIPGDLAVEVLERAERLGSREVEIRNALARGVTLSEALARFGHV